MKLFKLILTGRQQENCNSDELQHKLQTATTEEKEAQQETKPTHRDTQSFSSSFTSFHLTAVTEAEEPGEVQLD